MQEHASLLFSVGELLNIVPQTLLEKIFIEAIKERHVYK